MAGMRPCVQPVPLGPPTVLPSRMPTGALWGVASRSSGVAGWGLIYPVFAPAMCATPAVYYPVGGAFLVPQPGHAVAAPVAWAAVVPPAEGTDSNDSRDEQYCARLPTRARLHSTGSRSSFESSNQRSSRPGACPEPQRAPPLPSAVKAGGAGADPGQEAQSILGRPSQMATSGPVPSGAGRQVPAPLPAATGQCLVTAPSASPRLPAPTPSSGQPVPGAPGAQPCTPVPSAAASATVLSAEQQQAAEQRVRSFTQGLQLQQAWQLGAPGLNWPAYASGGGAAAGGIVRVVGADGRVTLRVRMRTLSSSDEIWVDVRRYRAILRRRRKREKLVLLGPRAPQRKVSVGSARPAPTSRCARGGSCSGATPPSEALREQAAGGFSKGGAAGAGAHAAGAPQPCGPPAAPDHAMAAGGALAAVPHGAAAALPARPPAPEPLSGAALAAMEAELEAVLAEDSDMALFCTDVLLGEDEGEGEPW